MWQYTLHFGMQHDDGTGSSRLITDKIAIVNLDEGITIHDEKVNYAEKLIINLDDNAQRHKIPRKPLTYTGSPGHCGGSILP